MQSLLNKLVCVSNDSCQSNGCHCNCAGQAADAISAQTQVKMEDAPKSLKLPESECPDFRIRRHKWPKSRSNFEDPLLLLERNLYGYPLAGFLRERQFDEVQLGPGWEKYRIGNVCLFIGNKDCSCRCAWMTLRWLEGSRVRLPYGRN